MTAVARAALLSNQAYTEEASSRHTPKAARARFVAHQRQRPQPEFRFPLGLFLAANSGSYSAAMDSSLPGPEFPWLLKRAWTLSDPATREDRLCDALGRMTTHQRFESLRGAYWICSQTGQMSRPPEPADDAQADAPDEQWSKELHEQSEERGAAYRRWLSGVERYRQTGRLFEVGCGGGTFLAAAVGAGWKGEGNELSAAKAEYASRRTGARVIPGPMERVVLEPGVYDLILCNNVFEHLYEPRQVLAHMAQALRPGGVLYLQTLNAQSLSLWFEPAGWLYFGPGHVFIPTLVSLGHYFRMAGLKVVSRQTHGFRCVRRAVDQSRPRRMAREKLMSLAAARLGRGHRVEYVLQRPS